jgi:hypothetical protein
MIQSRTDDKGRDFVAVVSGLPRSGTSMMMRMLDEGGMPVIADSIRGADEDNPRGYYEFEPVKKTAEDASWLENAEGKVVKMVYRLLYDLPADRRYRVVFMRRKMDEILASQKKMLLRKGKADNAPSDEEISALFNSQLASFLDWAKDQQHIELLEVHYNEVMSSPSEPASTIADFLGGELDTEAMCRVVEPELYRNRC